MQDLKTDWAIEFEDYWRRKQSVFFIWVMNWKKWVRYQDNDDEKGFFKPVEEEIFNKVFKDWADNHGIKFNPGNLKTAALRIKCEWPTLLEEFDVDLNIRNVLNGFLNLNTKTLSPHIPGYLSLRQANIKFKPKEKISPTPKWDSLFKYYPDMILIEWALRCIIFNDMSSEKSIFLVGPPRHGKGSLTDLLKQMFAHNMYSNVSIHDLNRDFHVAEMAGKNLNIDTEAIMSKVSSRVIMIFKKIVGRDGYVLCNPKGKALFDFKFIPFFFWTAMNKLFGLPPTDANAFYVRVVVAEMKDKPVKTDPNFKKDLIKESDDIFSKLVYAGPMTYEEAYKKRYNKDYNEKEHIELMSEKWRLWSDSVVIACRQLFKRQDDGINEISVDDVYESIVFWLEDNDYNVPSERSIKLRITHTFNGMRIAKKRRGNKEYVYTPIEYVIQKSDEDLPDQLEHESEGSLSLLDDMEEISIEDMAVEFMDWLEDKGLESFEYEQIEAFQKHTNISQKESYVIVTMCENVGFVKKNGKGWYVLDN
jgi:phage/plasmid-associated DNA primase